jgi:hypothetical protein
MTKVSTAATKQSRNISQQKLTIGLDLRRWIIASRLGFSRKRGIPLRIPRAALLLRCGSVTVQEKGTFKKMRLAFVRASMPATDASRSTALWNC